MAGTISVGSFAMDLLPGAVEWFGKGYNQRAPQYSQIFQVRSSDRAYERFAKTSGLGLPLVMDDGSAVSYDSMQQLWKVDFTHTKYGNGFVVTRDALDDQKSGIVLELGAKELGKGCAQQKELSCAAYLDNAFLTANGGDGKPLYSTSHPTLGADMRNRLLVDSDFAEAALEQACIDIADIRDERGLRTNIMPRKIIVSKENMFEFHRVLSSAGQVYTPDNTPNAIKDMNAFPEGAMVNNFLTDVNAFHVLTDVVDNGLIFLNRREPEVTTENVFDNENAKYKIIMRYSLGHIDPRCSFGTPGSF